MNHQNYQEMLAAQALNALDAGDAHLLEMHLETCAECRSQLSELQNTAAWLAFAAIDRKPVEPSRELRTRILRAVRSDTSNVVDLNSKRAWTSGQTWAAIAAALLFVAVGASLFVLWRQNRNARNEVTRVTTQLQEAQAEKARLQEAIAFMTAPGTRVSELAGTNEMPSAHATLAFDQTGRAILLASGLPKPPEGKAYQLWFIAGGRPMPGKVFTTDSSGNGMLNDHIPAEARASAVYAVTLEPATGADQPTGAIYLKS